MIFKKSGSFESRGTLPASSGAFIDVHPFRAFAVLTVFYLVVTAALSSLKLLWMDELITIHIAGLGSPTAIWQALNHGADPNPPLTHLAVLASSRLFGPHSYAFRLPAVVGYWVGMLALFLYVKQRLPATWAILGTVISMGMGGFEWSYESRSYALFYGTTMLALYCWSRATGPFASTRSGSYAVAGIALSLAAGLCANYFSVLAFVPIAAGELTRTAQKARPLWPEKGSGALVEAVDWRIWFALALAITPLLGFHALIEKSIALYSPYAWNKVTFDMTNIAYLDMVEAMLYPLAALALIAAAVWALGRPCDDCRARLRPGWIRALANASAQRQPRTAIPPLPEMVAVFTLMAYPYLGWALASLHGGMLSSRFVIPVCFGLAIAAAFVAYRTFGSFRAAGPLLLTFFLLWFMVRESYIGYSYSEQKDALYSTFAALHSVDHRGEPIVVSDNLLLLPFQYYAPRNVASRVVYPMDIAAIMHRRREASGEVNLWNGRSTYGFPILPLASFQHSVSTYLLVTSEPDWLLDDLHAHQYPDDILPVDTHAEPLNYVATPLSHFKSEIFRVYGDQFPFLNEISPEAIPFSFSGELPEAK